MDFDDEDMEQLKLSLNKVESDLKKLDDKHQKVEKNFSNMIEDL